MDHNTAQTLKARLRDMLLKADPDAQPEVLIRLTLLWGAYYDRSATEVTALMEELRKEFNISQSAIREAVAASPLLSEVWPTS
jgi:hypothetical protein